MASEYEIAKAMKVINETIRDETTTCDDCKVRRYCHRGYHANLCHGFSTEIKAWTSEQWDAHVEKAELEYEKWAYREVFKAIREWGEIVDGFMEGNDEV